MRVLLLQPPIQDFYDTDVRLQPIGLASLKAVARIYHPEVSVKVFDAHQGHGRHTVSWPKELEYLKEFYGFKDTSPFSTFHNYFHFGLSFEKILEIIKLENPDIVGISALFSPYFREVIKITELIKSNMPNIKILLGGSHVSALKEKILLDYSTVDYIIVGEGERAFCEFLEFQKGQRLITEVSSLGFRSHTGVIILNEIKENFNIESLPIPDFSDLDFSKYMLGKKPLSFIVSSRSCPHRCTFCSVHQTFGYKYRRQSVNRVFDEILKRYEQGFRIIDFEDDNLTFYKSEMKELCLKIIDKFKPGDLEFVAMNGISYLSLDAELLELMKLAGFTHLNLALVSSDISVRETTKRPHTVEKYVEIVNLASQLGFKIVSYQILGLPNESLKSMVQTLSFNAQLPVLLGASMFYLTPNSPIAKNIQPYPTEKDIFLSRLTSMAIETDGFKRPDLYTLFITTRIFDFIKNLDLESDLEFSNLVGIQMKNRNSPLISKGLEKIKILLKDKSLLMENNKDSKINSKFNYELFKSVWDSTPFIATRSLKASKKIYLHI
jgi:radical SAM superfamily enzyme YgiQ (UPF0313 family)